ncbi:MAG: GerMN domain-containing protein [Eubacteriales bacterium]|nr:GerMN domain-containing protein [Eubacteriales bacterium]
MRRFYRIFVLLAAFSLLASGCRKKEETADARIYYLTTEGNALTTEGYNWKSDQVMDRIDEVMKKLKKPEDTVACTSVIPSDVLITDYNLEDDRLEISFSQEYELLDRTKEVLLRAAVVKSLTQIEGVDFVQFRVAGELLRDGHGDVVGYMQGEDFVQNTGAALNSYQREDVTLYYVDSTGEQLVRSEVSLRYNSYMTIEKAIVERLINGPDEEGIRATIPPQTKLLGVAVKGDICYVNLDEGFLAEPFSVKPELEVYSLVNSVIAGGNCRQVQISVNGDTNISFRGQIDFSKPFEENMKIVEE